MVKLRIPPDVKNFLINYGVKNIGSFIGARLYEEVKSAIAPRLSGVNKKLVPWVTTQVIAGLIDYFVKTKSPRWGLFKESIVCGALACANNEAVKEGLPTLSELLVSQFIAKKTVEKLITKSMKRLEMQQPQSPPFKPQVSSGSSGGSELIEKKEKKVMLPPVR